MGADPQNVSVSGCQPRQAGEDILTKRGCNVMLLAALSLAAVIGLDIYIGWPGLCSRSLGLAVKSCQPGEKYPLEDIVRVEELRVYGH